MLTIRLTRVGKKKDSSFRVVVVESKRKVKAGNYLEMVGSYDPRVNKVSLNTERIKHWLNNGVTVSDTVHNLLVSNKIIDAKKRNVLPKKTVAVATSTTETTSTTSTTTEEPKAEEVKPEDNAVAEEPAAQ